MTKKMRLVQKLPFSFGTGAATFKQNRVETNCSHSPKLFKEFRKREMFSIRRRDSNKMIRITGQGNKTGNCCLRNTRN